MSGPRYGRPHRRVKARFAALVASGTYPCWRCGKPIDPRLPWDLGHVDGRPDLYAGPEHPGCNRATKGRRAKAKREFDETSGGLYLDIPERGIFWGPPSTLTGKPQRWSRAWWDWR